MNEHTGHLELTRILAAAALLERSERTDDLERRYG